MAKNSAAEAGDYKKDISEEELTELENETLEKASKTVAVIENAVSLWDASKTKPQEQVEIISNLKKFRDALAKWGSELGRARVKSAEKDERVGLLREFVEICYSYENA